MRRSSDATVEAEGNDQAPDRRVVVNRPSVYWTSPRLARMLFAMLDALLRIGVDTLALAVMVGVLLGLWIGRG